MTCSSGSLYNLRRFTKPLKTTRSEAVKSSGVHQSQNDNLYRINKEVALFSIKVQLTPLYSAAPREQQELKMQTRRECWCQAFTSFLTGLLKHTGRGWGIHRLTGMVAQSTQRTRGRERGLLMKPAGLWRSGMPLPYLSVYTAQVICC